MNDDELLALLRYIAQDYYYKYNLLYTLPTIDIGDLISWGYEGYVKGEERFDPTLGFKIQTYVSHWIKAEISGQLRKQMRQKAHLPTCEFMDDISYPINSRQIPCISHDIYLDLSKLLSTLTKREKKYMNMRFIEGMSEQEIGNIARYSKQNIDVITDKAIYKMRVRNQKLKYGGRSSDGRNNNVCNRTHITITAEENNQTDKYNYDNSYSNDFSTSSFYGSGN